MPFKNCTEAYQAGRSHIPASDPDYGKHLDRDNDGFGCDNPPPGFKPAEGTETGTGTKVPGAVDGAMLPKTGPAAELGIGGAAILLLGLAAVLIRKRRIRFSA